MLSYKEACKILCEKFPDYKVVGCDDYKHYYSCSLVPVNEKPIERKGSRWYGYCGNGFLVDKETGEISDEPSAPDYLEEYSHWAKPIFNELDDGYAYWLGKD